MYINMYAWSGETEGDQRLGLKILSAILSCLGGLFTLFLILFLHNILDCDNRQSVRLIGENNPIVKRNIRHINLSLKLGS